ncbi:MAG: HlyD family type I secretion periplasmic adaptor subunit, partial [Proteobacteria bacterium]|nr:HlyD family type I secretion periplasmic adaptor subunit [Pseudomonadota bacterium]
MAENDSVADGEFTTETQRHREGTEEKRNSFVSLCLLCVSVSLWFKPLWTKTQSWTITLRHRVAFLDKAVTKLESIAHGLSQHADIWREALKADKLRPKLGPLGEAEMAFLPAALEISERPASTTARIIALTLCAFFAGSIAWASIGELDIVAVASGKLIPSEQVKVIQPLEAAIVRAIHVSEGQTVKKGDMLIELEVTGGANDVQRLTQDLYTAQADSARLAALLAPAPDQAFTTPEGVPAPMIELARAQMVAQLTEHRGKLASLDSELARKRAELKTTSADMARLANVITQAQDRAGRRKILTEQGLNSHLDLSRAVQEVDEASGNREVAKSRLTETQAAIASLESQREQAKGEFRRDATSKLAEARAKASTAEQELAKATQRQKVLSLIAPVDGIAQQLDIHTIGGVVQPAQKLLVIVPAGAILEIEARLPNKDIAFVEAGQEAIIKVEAFPFTRYGTLKGRVTTVSLDAVQDEQKKEYYFLL